MSADGEFRGKPEDFRPTRGYAWEAFQPGHTLTLKHGAFSARTVDPVAAELVESLAGVEYISSVPEFAASVWGWARAEAKVQLVNKWLDHEGLLDADGKPRPAADLLVRLERQAAEARARLGLDPLSRARLGRDVTAAKFDLARLWQAEWEEEQAQKASGAAETPQDGPEGEEE